MVRYAMWCQDPRVKEIMCSVTQLDNTIHPANNLFTSFDGNNQEAVAYIEERLLPKNGFTLEWYDFTRSAYTHHVKALQVSESFCVP